MQNEGSRNLAAEPLDAKLTELFAHTRIRTTETLAEGWKLSTGHLCLLAMSDSLEMSGLK